MNSGQSSMASINNTKKTLGVYMGVSTMQRSIFVGVSIIRALLFGVYITAPDVGNSHMCVYNMYMYVY